MAKNTSGMRFESREIAVILSLFIFVSLLMFTVGIVVGKGLAQAKYAGTVPPEASHERQLSSSPTPESAPQHETTAPTGTSVSSHPPIIENKTPPVAEAAAQPETHPTSETHWAKAPLEESPKKEEPEPLELKTKKSGNLDVHQDLQADYLTEETEKVLKNAHLADLFEAEPATAPKAKSQAKGPRVASKDTDEVVERDFSQLNAERSVASAVSPSTPKSFGKGAYSVQVAAYSEEAQALERVDALKKLGFPHAYFSAIELGENKEKWFRVWLGYYPSFESAKAGGEALQARGEVKNYLVRKTENSRTKN
ncbi:MAG: SPOR domain-containing protein [Deltaproteobacteria bacterium]